MTIAVSLCLAMRFRDIQRAPYSVFSLVFLHIALFAFLVPYRVSHGVVPTLIYAYILLLSPVVIGVAGLRVYRLRSYSPFHVWAFRLSIGYVLVVGALVCTAAALLFFYAL
jgi:hypothetical protein